MGHHAKTRTFTVEFYRLVSTTPAGAGRVETNDQAKATFAYADTSSDGPMNTVFSRTPILADKGNVVVMDTLVIRDDTDDTADPAALSAITIDSATPGTHKGWPSLYMPSKAPSVTTVAHQVSYTQPQAARFIKRSGLVLYSGGPLHLNYFAGRAVRVEQADPAPLDGYRRIDFDDTRWTDPLYTPGTDLHFDMAWSDCAGISTALRLTFEV